METDLEFVREMQQWRSSEWNEQNCERLLRLAETAALIGEHDLSVMRLPVSGWTVRASKPDLYESATNQDVHTAVRAVAAKIQEGK